LVFILVKVSQREPRQHTVSQQPMMLHRSSCRCHHRRRSCPPMATRRPCRSIPMGGCGM
jgi:hypothetical protein